MLFKIVHNEVENCISVLPSDRDQDGKVLLTYEADTFEQAMFVRNQFLGWEPYRPFGKFWIAQVEHSIWVNNKLKRKHNCEIRTMIVLADTVTEAEEKLKEEAKNYGKTYRNTYKQPVEWRFEKITDIREMDFFNTIDLYRGVPVEVYDKRISRRAKKMD
jgi:Domain of unknown function (DUF4288)